MEPIVFTPLPMIRVWGGRELEKVYGRALPDDSPYGESWEMVDREGEQSVVLNGAYAGMSLHELWTEKREEIFGVGLPDSERFPVLVKILDARDDLSVQVHPPTHKAAELGGEPKTEMWYIADAVPGAKLFVGLKAHSGREAFEQAIADGTVADHVHEIAVNEGDSIFIPSGRLHAIGAGLLIFEIQQNSDTTYRVFDWNRMGLDGKPRELHIRESLESIDFADVEPEMDDTASGVIVDCDFFVVDRHVLRDGCELGNARGERFSLLHIVRGNLLDCAGKLWTAGTSMLLPVGAAMLKSQGDSVVLRTTMPG